MSTVSLRSVTDRVSAVPPAARDLRLVPPPQHPRRYLVIGILLVALGVFGVVSLHALASESTFQARQLEQRVTELSLARDQLTAEVARLESPQHLREVAQQQLGMVQASEPGYLVAGRSAPADPRVALDQDEAGEPGGRG